jgi:hypothetical protein
MNLRQTCTAIVWFLCIYNLLWLIDLISWFFLVVVSEKDPGNWLYPARIVVVILAFSTLANFLWRFRQTLD